MRTKKKWTRKRNKGESFFFLKKKLRQRWLFLKKKRSKPRDQNKESKKLGKDTHLKKTILTRRCSQKVCKQQKKNKRERKDRQTKKYSKKEQENTKGVTSFYKQVPKINWRRGSGKKKSSEKKSKARGDQEKKSWNKKSFEKGHETKQREENTIITKRNKERKKKRKTLSKKRREINESKKTRRNKKRNETVYCNGWPAADFRVIATTEQTTIRERWEKRRKPGGAKDFFREKHEVISNKKCKKDKIVHKNGVWKFALFLKSKKMRIQRRDLNEQRAQTKIFWP